MIRLAESKEAMSQYNFEDLLIRLGLTGSQAKVYPALARLGTANAGTISKKSGVARADIYKIMPKLENIGIVERIVSVPIRFKAKSPIQCVSILIDRRKNEIDDLETKSKVLAEQFERNNKNEAFEQEGQFIMIPPKQANLRKRLTLIRNAVHSIDSITTGRRLQTVPLALFDETTTALRRGVKIRVISEKPEDVREVPEMINRFRVWCDYELRYSTGWPPAVLSIFDKKETLITVSAEALPGESPALWTNNTSMVGMLQKYFENLWLTSIKHDAPALAKISG